MHMFTDDLSFSPSTRHSVYVHVYGFVINTEPSVLVGAPLAIAIRALGGNRMRPISLTSPGVQTETAAPQSTMHVILLV